MDCCAYKTLLDKHIEQTSSTPCGQSRDYPGDVGHIELKSCTRDVVGHLQSLKLSADEGINSELKLLLARAGK